MKSILILSVFYLTSWAEPSFTTPPSITGSGNDWQITFAVSESTDVEVAVVNREDSTVIRHLAAGVLGSNPPAPLTARSLSQTLLWDGRDDLGHAVSLAAGSIGVRVRAGMGAEFEQVCGGSPYAFHLMNGLLAGDDGLMYVFGGGGNNDFVTTRAYDGDGNYLRTVFPYPASLASAQVSGFGINNWLNGKYSPKTTSVAWPNLSSTLVSSSSAQLIAFQPTDGLLYGDLRRNRMIKIKTDGSIDNDGVALPIVTSPAFIGWYNVGGPLYGTVSPDGRSFYLSGIYFATSTGTGYYDSLLVAPDTGFWRDGRVYRVDMATGIAQPFITLDSVPQYIRDRKANIGEIFSGNGPAYYGAVHGTDVDDSGRVFICDRHHNRIGVYDTAGAYLGGIPVKWPDMVKVDRVHGTVYAVTRVCDGYYTGSLKIFKFAGWRNNPAPVCSVEVTRSISTSGVRPHLALTHANTGDALVWITYWTSVGVRAYRDDGGAFTLQTDFTTRTTGVNIGFDRMKVDRRNERVFVNNAWGTLYQIEDWSAPKVLACSTSAGRPLPASDLAVSRDHQLYIQDGSAYSGPITRWGMDGHYLDSIPYPNSGTNELTHYIYGRMHGLGGYGEKGLAVAPDKKVAVVYMYDFSAYFTGVFADSGCLNDTQYVDTVVKPMGVGDVGGVEFDSKGNLYVGITTKAANHVTPSAFEGEDQYGVYTRHVGAVVRFPAGSKGSVTNNVPSGSDFIYPQGYAPLSGWGGCACRSPRFDIDPYDRLVMPCAITQKVSVADNNGNTILDFGEYGNQDSWGSSSPVPTSDVPFAWPVAAAATDNFIYVSDMVNTRVVRVRKTFALDNLPGYPTASDNGGSAARSVAMAASPNPFNPDCRIRVTLPGDGALRLSLYDASGRLVRALASGHFKAGTHFFVWNGRDQAGRALSSGWYAARLTAGGKTLSRRVMMVR